MFLNNLLLHRLPQVDVNPSGVVIVRCEVVKTVGGGGGLGGSSPVRNPIFTNQIFG